MPVRRFAANTAKVSGAAMAIWVLAEGFSPTPYVPTKGDVPTIGHGATYYENGQRVTLNDKPIDRKRAYELALFHVEHEAASCVRNKLGGTPVSQVEFDLATSFVGQYGCATYQNSSLAGKTMRGQYRQACQVYLQYKFVAGRDCSNPINWVGKDGCKGVWTRAQERFQSCMAAQ